MTLSKSSLSQAKLRRFFLAIAFSMCMVVQVQAADECWPNSDNRKQVITSASLQEERNSAPVANTTIIEFSSGTPAANLAGPALQINAAAGRHPISPYIYGINFAEEALAVELRLSVRRWGDPFFGLVPAANAGL
jgi:hypothetical protein